MIRIVHRSAGGGNVQNLGPYRLEALLERHECAALSAYRVQVAAGATSATSHHRVAEEVYFVLAGGGSAILDGQEHPLKAGDFLRLPPGTRHAFRAGPEGLDMLDLHAPGCFPDHDTFFDGAPPEGFGRG